MLKAKPKQDEGHGNSGQNSGQNQEEVVTLTFTSWNHVRVWLRLIGALRQAAPRACDYIGAT
jgi:hypothetical protein